MTWSGKQVLVTGGASFIGSHLTEALVAAGALVTVVDDLSSGKLENLANARGVTFVKLDLEHPDPRELSAAFRGQGVIFHLAAVHGGRGYIDSHPADVASNFAIDHHVMEAALKGGAERVVYASSACVYPPQLQTDTASTYLLKEEDSDLEAQDPFLSADLEYGWAKLMGEMQLRAFRRQYGLKGCSLRFVTAYGERENESHAIIALIYKAFERSDPFPVWGDGSQLRDFTYVGDIVSGTLRAAEVLDNAEAVNLGTGERHRLSEVANTILDMMDFHPVIVFDRSSPTGVVNRALDISKAQKLLGWRPSVTLREGLRRTIDWYVQTHTRSGSVNRRMLTERSVNIPLESQRLGSG